MDTATAQQLSRLTSSFYAEVNESFSATRQGAWLGWQRVLEETALLQTENPHLLDVACGNLRFERFVSDARQEAACTTTLYVQAFDNCDELAVVPSLEQTSITYSNLDIASCAMDAPCLEAKLGQHSYDLAVCFGFMHHLPLAEQRATLLRALVSSVVPGGFVAISFWQLSNSERLLAKARASTKRATHELGISGLEEGDYLLGWQDRSDVVRYCHDFSEAEIDELAASVAPHACEVARFSADGATGNLNRYLVLQRTTPAQAESQR